MQPQSSFDRRSMLAMLGATGVANGIGQKSIAAEITQAKALLPGALQSFDLPEVHASVAQKGLNMIAPWTSQDGMNA